MKRYALILLILTLLCSCRKSFKEPAAAAPVTMEFDASAYDTNTILDIQIYDTNTKGVYYRGTTTSNIYSGQCQVQAGASVTFQVNASTTTDVNSQISNNGQIVASGNYNAAQSQGLAPGITLYYKVPLN